MDLGFAPSPVQNLRPAGTDIFVAGYGDDRGLVVKFYTEATLMGAKSEAAGRPIYEDVDYIHMFLPGGKTDVKRPVKLVDDDRSPSDPHRFPRQYEAFKNQKGEAHDGTPLEHIAFIPRARVMEFKAQNIHTAEQLIAVPDSASDRMGMDFRSFREKVKTWISNADKNAEVLQLKGENDQLKADMEALKAQFAEFSKTHSKKDK